MDKLPNDQSLSAKKTCFAYDTIVVEGHMVEYMYRNEPENENDSGWCFHQALCFRRLGLRIEASNDPRVQDLLASHQL